MRKTVSILALSAFLAASLPAEARSRGGKQDEDIFADIGKTEELQVIGSVPSWTGQVRGGRMVYRSSAKPLGETIAVQRAAGPTGLLFTGNLDEGTFIMAVTQGDCSDGMTARVFPFTAEFRIGGATFKACGWSEQHPFREE
jgi:uncharacterized membrane protein